MSLAVKVLKVSFVDFFSFIPDFLLKRIIILSPYIHLTKRASLLNKAVSNHTAVFTLYFTVGSFHYFASSNTVTTILKRISYTTQHTHGGALCVSTSTSVEREEFFAERKREYNETFIW